MSRTIGILGGMGPRATVEFERMLLDRLAGSDQALPTIVTINDGAIPDRSDFLLGRGPDPAPRMLRNALKLERLGADFIAVPCNTACMPAILDRVRRQLTVPVIDLPAEAVRALSGVRSACLLATEGTVRAGCYQELCAAAGIECVVPDVTTRRRVMNVIRAVKAGRFELAKRLAARIRLPRADAVILGCTELPLVATQLVPPGAIAVDTLAVLADRCATLVKTETRNDTRPIHA